MSGAPRLLNREASWLDFDRRVLALAEDPERPLLERVKFLAIFARNLDEFFQVRVAGLQDAAELDRGSRSPDGLTASEQLARIRVRVEEIVGEAQDLWSSQLRPALRDAGVELVAWAGLPEAERAWTTHEFGERIQPALVPLSVDPSHPFPYISNLSLNVGALVRPRGGGPERFARVKVPRLVDRWQPTGPASGRFVDRRDDCRGGRRQS